MPWQNTLLRPVPVPLHCAFHPCCRTRQNSGGRVLPKRHEKEIIRLEPNEVAILLDQVEDGTKLTKKELEYHKKTKLRDIALLTLLTE